MNPVVIIIPIAIRNVSREGIGRAFFAAFKAFKPFFFILFVGLIPGGPMVGAAAVRAKVFHSDQLSVISEQ